MNTMDQTQYLNHLMLDPNQQYVYYNQQQMLLQQQELQRISQVQQQAAYQQQRALMYQQTMMYYEQQMMMDQQQQQYHHHDYDSGSASSPPQEGQLPQGVTTMGKAQRRAEHNAIERARRESLNSKFQQLAHSLPNLQDDRRPSKGTIIERTLEYVKQTVQKEERFQTEIEKLRQANESLISKITTNEPIDELDELDDDCQSSVTSGTSNDMYLFEQDTSNTTTTLLLNKEFL